MDFLMELIITHFQSHPLYLPPPSHRPCGHNAPGASPARGRRRFGAGATATVQPGDAALPCRTAANGVTSIGGSAFDSCAKLTNITIPASVTSIGAGAFFSCATLTRVYFESNVRSIGSDVFLTDKNVTVYYLPGATGWSSTFGDAPAMLWNPFGPSGDANVHVQANQFGFNFTGPANLLILVDACANLANPIWIPLTTNILRDCCRRGCASRFGEPILDGGVKRHFRQRFTANGFVKLLREPSVDLRLKHELLLSQFFRR
jgi:hypothetical protein